MGPTTRLWMQRLSTFKGLIALPRTIWNSFKGITVKYFEIIAMAAVCFGIMGTVVFAVWHDTNAREPATAEEIISARKESWCMNDYLPKYAAGINGRFLRRSDINTAREQCEKAVHEFEMRQQQERALGVTK